MRSVTRLAAAATRRFGLLVAVLLAPGDGIAPRGAGVRRTPLERLPEGGGLGGGPGAGPGGDGGGC